MFPGNTIPIPNNLFQVLILVFLSAIIFKRPPDDDNANAPIDLSRSDSYRRDDKEKYRAALVAPG